MSSISPFLHQKGMQKAPPLQRDVQSRADEGSINRMTGGSKTHGTPYHGRTIHHARIGDHREAGHHTGPQNSSAVPRTRPGVPIHNGRNGNGVE
jgi:hypothetical protein